MNAEPQDTTAKVNAPTDKEYVEIIKSDSVIDKAFIEQEGKAAKIVYYCTECKKPVTPKRIGKKLSFKCSECEKSPIAFGTEESIKNYYNIK
jgi:ribosomal protein L37AE/L43A